MLPWKIILCWKSPLQLSLSVTKKWQHISSQPGCPIKILTFWMLLYSTTSCTNSNVINRIYFNCLVRPTNIKMPPQNPCNTTSTNIWLRRFSPSVNISHLILFICKKGKHLEESADDNIFRYMVSGSYIIPLSSYWSWVNENIILPSD